MYARDQAAIAARVAIGQPGWQLRLAGVGLATLMTAMTNTNAVMCRTTKFREGRWYHPDDAGQRSLYQQVDTFYTQSIATGLYAHAMDMVRAHVAVGDDARALLTLARLPGMGPAKAGFTLQMAFGIVGCIDSENSKFYGVAVPKSYKGMSDACAHARACDYVALIQKLGGGPAMWDTWCGFIATRPGNRHHWHGDADALSADHVIWIDNVLTGLGV